MALSDPVNVRLGAERRKKTLQKLALQMAARAGGRGGGAGAMFRSNVQGRGSARPSMRLPFELPTGRMRPGGFDPQPDNGAQWGPPPVLTSGPPSMGGGSMFASQTEPTLNAAGYPENTSYADLGVEPTPITGPDATPWIQGPNNMPPMGTITQSDVPLGQAMPSMAYPDPWTIMAEQQLRRLMGGVGGRTYGV